MFSPARLKRLSVRIDLADGGSEGLFVEEEVLVFVCLHGVYCNFIGIAVCQPQLGKRHGKLDAVVELCDAVHFFIFSEVGMQDEDAEGDDLTVQIFTFAGDSGCAVVKGMCVAGVVIKILLVGEIRGVACGDENIEGDFFNGLADAVLPHIFKSFLAVGIESVLGGGGNRCTKNCRVRQVFRALFCMADAVLDFGSLADAIADACPEVFSRGIGNNFRVNEDMCRRIRVAIMVKRAIFVIDDGNTCAGRTI